jgi:hypothetical protein
MSGSRHLPHVLVVFAAFSLLAPACGSFLGLPGGPDLAEIEQAASQTAQSIAMAESPEPTLTATPPPTFTPTATSTPSPTPVTVVWMSPLLPSGFQTLFSPPPGWRSAENADAATVQLDLGSGRTVASWIYALVVPFPTTVDGVTGGQLRDRWAGKPAGRFGLLPLMMDQNTLDVLTVEFGPPAPGAVQVVPADQLVDVAWNTRPSWAIVPFEALEPHWKVLTIDGQSPLRKDFSPEGYPLTIHIAVEGAGADAALAMAADGIPATNRDPAKLTTVVMTGVTALVRGTAWLMEQHGVLYPAQDVGEILRSADITHISNEVAFASDCPYPDPSPGMRLFCSDPRYIDLLESVGTDVVELTGNHLQDWGSDAMLYTLDLYRQRGWLYFGGGSNLEEARKPAMIEHNGNRLAFLGCNVVPNDPSWATDSTPGSAPCDPAYFLGEVASLRASGYLPIMTFQYNETYHDAPTDAQRQDFLDMAAAGAVIVSGSQSHFPQTFSVRNGSLIHFGLGNLFFDQYYISQGTRTAFIDRHVFYGGRYLGAELITIIFEDNARARLMNAEEREALLTEVFSGFIW